MTFSIDDLPAPFGPMMARISPLRMSKLTLVSARTPPNRSEMLVDGLSSDDPARRAEGYLP